MNYNQTTKTLQIFCHFHLLNLTSLIQWYQQIWYSHVFGVSLLSFCVRKLPICTLSLSQWFINGSELNIFKLSSSLLIWSSDSKWSLVNRLHQSDFTLNICKNILSNLVFENGMTNNILNKCNTFLHFDLSLLLVKTCFQMSR